MNLDLKEFVDRESSFSLKRAKELIKDAYHEAMISKQKDPGIHYRYLIMFLTAYVIFNLKKERVKKMTGSDKEFYAAIGFPQEVFHIRQTFTEAAMVYPALISEAITGIEIVHENIHENDFKAEMIKYFRLAFNLNVTEFV